MSSVYIVMGSAGEYSERSEWPIHARMTEQQAQEDVAHLSDLSRAMIVTLAEHSYTANEILSGTDEYEWDADLGTVATPMLAEAKTLDNGGDSEMLKQVLYNGYGGIRYFYYTVSVKE